MRKDLAAPATYESRSTFSRPLLGGLYTWIVRYSFDKFAVVAGTGNLRVDDGGCNQLNPVDLADEYNRRFQNVFKDKIDIRIVSTDFYLWNTCCEFYEFLSSD